MEFENVMFWTNICALPLTTVVIFWVFCVLRGEQAPIIYYINLLTSNLIQFIMIILLKHHHPNQIIFITYIVGLTAGVYFRMFIAIERCFVITRPQLNWIRQIGWSLLVSVLVWILCFTIVTLSIASHQFILLIVFGLLPAPLFIFFLAWTFKALSAATSVPTDEKRRIAGTLDLLFINWFLISFSTIIYYIGMFLYFIDFAAVFFYIGFVLFLLSPYTDLILFFFMRKGPVDKLLSYLCCCITDNTAADVAGHQQLHELMLQRESEPNCVKTVEKITKPQPLQILQ